jgi:hypothetical protein
MQFSVGIWDWLFGEKAEIELPNGQKRKVSVRWVKEMERKGRLKPVPKADRTIRVHSLGKSPDFGGDISRLDEWLSSGGKTYAVEVWQVGVQIPSEQVEKWRDPETGELYVVNQIVDGKWKFAYCTRQVWERFKTRFQNRRSTIIRQASLAKLWNRRA